MAERVYFLYSNYNVESKEVISFLGNYELWQYIIPICCDSIDAHKIVGNRSLEIPCIVITDGNNVDYNSGPKLKTILKNIYEAHNQPPHIPAGMTQNSTTTLPNINIPEASGDNRRVHFSPNVDTYEPEKIANDQVNETRINIGDIPDLSTGQPPKHSDPKRQMMDNIKKMADEQRRKAEEFNDGLTIPRV